ncbi:excisionase family DNA-binding protein [Streptomyces anulatus]|uniref:excisionase family DNA-binding protein n=1 Tax=Streptomyces anulatus TaxID=1892 RepID=UPI0038699627|nr:excisionase family DNA-binding protein [Streptomyces anulatus]
MDVMGSVSERRPLATPDQLATYLGVPKSTIYQWSSRGGGVPLFRVGRHLRARWSDVDAWLEMQETAKEAA